MIVNASVRASIATDQHPVYEYFAPLAAAVWRHRVGFEPLVTLVGYEEEWLALRRSRYVLDELHLAGIEPQFVATPNGYRSANLAQVARFYAALSRGLLDSDTVITTDVDMWPIDRDWFWRHLPSSGQVTSYYANFPSRFPMCYVAANRTTWCEMLAPAAFGGHHAREAWMGVDLARSHLVNHLTPETAAPDAWQHDEEFLTARVHALGAERIRMVCRPAGEPFPDRIDRVNWPRRKLRPTPSIAGMKDAHLLRPGYEHWDDLRPLFAQLCPDLVGWADAYTANYRERL